MRSLDAQTGLIVEGHLLVTLDALCQHFFELMVALLGLPVSLHILHQEDLDLANLRELPRGELFLDAVFFSEILSLFVLLP